MVFACSVSHTPGIRAWAEAAATESRERLYAGFEELRERLHAAKLDAILIITSEHCANFFLDCMPAFTMGQAERYFGPVEPWVKIDQGFSPGHPALSDRLLRPCYEHGVELNYAAYSDEEFEQRGLGTHEIRTWIAVAGIAEGQSTKRLFYEPIVGWATGCGLLYYE
jgi:hypothetical protein